MPSFTINELLNATGGELLHKGEENKVSGVSTDTRTIKQKELFIALRGENFNGHDYILQAITGGAGAVIVSEEITKVEETTIVNGTTLVRKTTIIKVPDTLVALGDIARFHRQRFDIPVIAITGSNGKTTTKELVSTVLTAKYKVVKTKLNFNNEIGLPLTLLEMNESTEAVVLEMGMRGQGQIAYLARIAEPTIGIITNVGVTHIELLGSKEAIADAKSELISALPANGIAILNGDDPLVAAMNKLFTGISYFYGIKEKKLDIKALEIVPGKNGQYIKTTGRWGRFSFFLPLPGEHNVANALAAVAVGLILGISNTQMEKAFETLPEMEKRLRIIQVGKITVIDDTYNASPPSVIAALTVLKNLPDTKRKIAVFGDMLELGNISKKAHKEIGEAVAEGKCSALFAYGPESYETVSAAEKKSVYARHYENKNNLFNDLIEYISPGDAILIKGSRGMKMEEIVSKLLRTIDKASN